MVQYGVEKGLDFVAHPMHLSGCNSVCSIHDLSRYQFPVYIRYIL